jgi:hypothetical protein
MRARMMALFTDPELARYRVFAADRVGALDRKGFPGPHTAEARPGQPERARVWVGLAAGAAAVTVAFVLGSLGGFQATVGGISSGSGAPWGASAQPEAQRRGDTSSGARNGGAHARQATMPPVPEAGLLRPGGRAHQTILIPSPVPRARSPVPGRTPPHQPPGSSPPGPFVQLEVRPISLYLGTGSTGHIVLSVTATP